MGPADLLVTKDIHPLAVGVLPDSSGTDIVRFARSSAPRISRLLADHGAILFRSFATDGGLKLAEVARAISGKLLGYEFGSTPRSQVAQDVFTASDYPPDQTIPLHNEMSYTTWWPSQLWFASALVAEIGGETPLADSRKVLARIPKDIVERFEQHGVMYTRNFTPGLDVSWQQTFQTSDRTAVESFCRRAGIESHWLNDDSLCTRQVAQATSVHPDTGEKVWFNQAHLFHHSALPHDVGEALLDLVGEDGLPRNAYFGDGSRIPEEILAAIRSAYDAEKRYAAWQLGDVMLLDNVLTAHGRNPFSGSRRVLVTMGAPAGRAPASAED